LSFRNQEIKNLFKTLKESALNYKQKNKSKLSNLKNEIQSLKDTKLNNESDNETIIRESRFKEESSANLNEIMRQSREKETDFTTQIKSKAKQVDELKNQILH